MQNVTFERIQKDISESDIVLYMKGSAAFPQCSFSALAVQILSQLGVLFKEINILEEKEIRQGIKDFSNWPTVPQLYIKGEFIGGSDIMHEMYVSGDLQQLLDNKNITYNKNIA
ncbi:MAG: Grx4 family monothiol glutaredoxin [Alphaproteobacteria bacterium]|nr:Grx4 family monothiol glutaredoxin [Alphaproteobacteria bacterium]